MSNINDPLKNLWAESQAEWSEERLRRIETSRQRYELKPVSMRARVLAIPILGRMIYWAWLLLCLHRWVPELLEMRERFQHTLLRVSSYELAVRDHLLAGLSRDKQGELIYQHHLPKSVYLALEERLRGGSLEVATKRSDYLPQVQMVASSLQLPVLDLGHSHKEWFAQLESVGVQVCSSGVPTSDSCKLLLAQKPGSLAVISAFQLVEHMPVAELWTLLEAAYKALAPGGLLLIETPNSENIQVAAYSFRSNLNQLHLLPPPLLEVLVRQAGFDSIEIKRFDAWPEMTKAGSECPEYLRKLLFCEQAYALLAYKHGDDVNQT